MQVGFWAEGIACVVLVLAVYIKREGMKAYVVLWLFAAWFSDVIGILGTQHLHLWKYPGGIFYGIGLWFIGDDILIPTIAIFVVRYWPNGRQAGTIWAVAIAAILTALEYMLERFTNLIAYENGYEWYYSLFVWLASVVVWRLFQNWFYGRRYYHAY